jgi:hypothetical protein
MEPLSITANIIYVVCPAKARTGGPELLHQLVYTLNKIKKKAYIVYTGIENHKYEIINEYNHYISGYLLKGEIEDYSDNLLIVPEVDVLFLNQFKNIQKAVWWLSVDNFFLKYFSFQSLKYYHFSLARNIYLTIINTKNLLFNKTRYLSSNNKVFKSVSYNFVQSNYAMTFCKKNNYKNIFFLSDYLNEIFLTNGTNNMKEDIILYNPSKGYKFTQKIIRTLNYNVKFIPLRNLSREEVFSLMQRAKVYIDFGTHPGKDRMPREACSLGCIVITGKKGSAKYYADIPLDDKHKFKDKYCNIKVIQDAIIYAIENYIQDSRNMENYINFIRNEKDDFINTVNILFGSSSSL